MLTIISLVLNLLLSLGITVMLIILKPQKRIKEKATITFFRTQLECVANDRGRKRYRADLFQKFILGSFYKFLGYPKNLCYIFKPETLLKWYRDRVKSFWTYATNSGNSGRQVISRATIVLILRIKRENPSWGARRISGELLKLNITVSKSKVAEILLRHGLNPDDEPSLTWKNFIKSHIQSLIGCDFKTVTTIFGIRFYILFFISHSSRKIVHFNITTNPTKSRMEQQLRNLRLSLGHDEKLYIIRDNDMIHRTVDFEKFDFTDVPIVPFTPNMNALTERFIGSFKREAFNDFIVFNEKQLRYITGEYVKYYNNYRPHQGLGNLTIPQYESGKDTGVISSSPAGRIRCRRFLGGKLKHYYYDNVGLPSQPDGSGSLAGDNPKGLLPAA